MWILGNLLSSNPTILYTIDDNDLKRKKTTKTLERILTKRIYHYGKDL